MILFKSYNHRKVFFKYLIRSLFLIVALIAYIFYADFMITLSLVFEDRLNVFENKLNQVVLGLVTLLVLLLPFSLIGLWYFSTSESDKLDEAEKELQDTLTRDAPEPYGERNTWRSH